MKRVTQLNEIPKTGKIVILFNNPDCQSCQEFAPKLQHILTESKKKNIDWFNVNSEISPELTSKFKVYFFPTIIVMENGQEVKRGVGTKEIEKF